MPAEGDLHAKLQGRYGGNLDCRELRAGATVVLPVEHDGAGLYFGDCKALMGDGEIVGPPEVGALVTASAEPRRATRLDAVAADRDGRRADDPRLRHSRSSGAPARRSGSCSNWVAEDFDLPRAEGRAAARDGGARRHLPDQQHRLHGVLRDAARRARAVPPHVVPLANETARGDADHVVDDAVAHGEQRRRGGSCNRRRGSG